MVRHLGSALVHRSFLGIKTASIPYNLQLDLRALDIKCVNQNSAHLFQNSLLITVCGDSAEHQDFSGDQRPLLNNENKNSDS